jgi:hypothetical protein
MLDVSNYPNAMARVYTCHLKPKDHVGVSVCTGPKG